MIIKDEGMDEVREGESAQRGKNLSQEKHGILLQGWKDKTDF